MRVGITGAVSLEPLIPFLGPEAALPSTYSFPLVGELAAELLRRGHGVTVFGASLEIAQPACWENGNLRVHVVPLRRRKAPYDFYRAERAWLTPLMRESNCEVIHAHWTYEFAASALASGKPTLVTAHDSPWAILRYFAGGRAFPFWFFRVLLARKVIREARWLSTVSEYCREHIQRTIKPSGNFRVIPNGVGDKLLALGAERLVRDTPIVGQKIAILSEGFSSRKNSRRALEAFALLREAFPEASLHFFGTGHEEGGPAAAWAKQKGLDRGVVFRGKVSPEVLMPELARDFSLLLHPSLEESFGMAPLEAMALGLPVIGGRESGAVPWVIGQAGLLVPVKSSQAMAEAMGQILGNPNLAGKFGSEGHRRALEHFSFATMVDRYLGCYEEICRQHTQTMVTLPR